MPALSLPALRQAAAAEFFQEIRDAFTQAATRTASSPSATSTSARAPPSRSGGGPRSPPGFTPPERALADPNPAVRDQAVRDAAEIVQAACREVAGG